MNNLLDTKNPETAIMVDAALDWVEKNTTLEIDRENLPSTVKLFVLKYCDLMHQTGIASESLGGMSQSFSTSSGIGLALSDLATQLFGNAYKGRNRFIAAQSRWK